MTIHLQNHITLQWLRKINPQLISLVRIEYCDELKAGTQLAALVPRIYVIIDSLLARHGTLNINLVWNETTEEEGNINRFQGTRGGLQASGRGGRGSRGSDRGIYRGGGQTRSSGLFCPGCFSFAKTSNLPVNFHHSPSRCYRKELNSRMVEAQDEDQAGDFPGGDHAKNLNLDNSGGYSSPLVSSHPVPPSQTSELEKQHSFSVNVNINTVPISPQTICSQDTIPTISSNYAPISETYAPTFRDFSCKYF